MSLIVIADSSALMALDNIGEADVLPKLYSEITITPDVAREYGRQLPTWIEIRAASEVSIRRPEISNLDPGEASSIALALDSEDPLLIIDEKKGRRVAASLNIEIVGTVGILIRAKIAGFIEQPETLLSRLKAVDFRLDENLSDRLMDSGEKNS